MNWNLYEHEKMKDVKKEHPDWIWNRGDTHVILGVPGSLEAFKTPVEPGNSFSPGPGTYGVSSWVFADGMLHAPEEKRLEEMEWGFEEGYLPLLNSGWMAGSIHVRSALFTAMEEDAFRDYFTVRLKNEGEKKEEIRFYLVIRSFGASGGPVHSIKSDRRQVWINGASMVLAETQAAAFGAVSFEESHRDISEYLRTGTLPDKTEVQDGSTWASGAMEYRIVLGAGEEAELNFGFLMHADHWLNGWMKPLQLPLDVAGKRKKYLKEWEERIKIRLKLPDKRISDALLCQLVHLYMFTVDNSVRITPVSYPLWWLRDGAYVLNALNKGGFHDFSERACREIAARDAFGGFGSEGDGPSDGIWVLTEHYLLTRDTRFLKEMFPHITRRAELLMQMRRAEAPVRKFTEFVIPKCMLDPNTDLMCLPAEDGLIMGRMDHGIRVFWVNGFAYMAMKRTAFCARELGLDDSVYEREAEEIKEALCSRAEADFGKDDRDVNSALWPAGWADRGDPLIRGRFQEFWDKVRCPGGCHSPEKDWTYFEAGEAHNYLLLGEREKAWTSIEWFLQNQTAPGLYTYPEAIDGNTALLWPRTRGWDDTEFVTPHGWTAAELFHLLRDCLIREEGGRLIIGSGIPLEWEYSSFEVKDIPTYFGKVGFSYNPDRKLLTVYTDAGCSAEITHELPFEADIEVGQVE